MTFWIAALGMTGAVVALMLLALFRRSRAQAGALSDLQVYKDQLAEVERDLARGTVTEAEAETVRTEVARRLLEADRATLATISASRSSFSKRPIRSSITPSTRAGNSSQSSTGPSIHRPCSSCTRFPRSCIFRSSSMVNKGCPPV